MRGLRVDLGFEEIMTVEVSIEKTEPTNPNEVVVEVWQKHSGGDQLVETMPLNEKVFAMLWSARYLIVKEVRSGT